MALDYQTNNPISRKSCTMNNRIILYSMIDILFFLFFFFVDFWLFYLTRNYTAFLSLLQFRVLFIFFYSDFWLLHFIFLSFFHYSAFILFHVFIFLFVYITFLEWFIRTKIFIFMQNLNLQKFSKCTWWYTKSIIILLSTFLIHKNSHTLI